MKNYGWRIAAIVLLLCVICFACVSASAQDIMRYTVVQGTDYQNIEEKVLALTQQGWELQGGVAVEPNSGSRLFYQALVLGSQKK